MHIQVELQLSRSKRHMKIQKTIIDHVISVESHCLMNKRKYIHVLDS